MKNCLNTIENKKNRKRVIILHSWKFEMIVAIKIYKLYNEDGKDFNIKLLLKDYCSPPTESGFYCPSFISNSVTNIHQDQISFPEVY